MHLLVLNLVSFIKYEMSEVYILRISIDMCYPRLIHVSSTNLVYLIVSLITKVIKGELLQPFGVLLYCFDRRKSESLTLDV